MKKILSLSILFISFFNTSISQNVIIEGSPKKVLFSKPFKTTSLSYEECDFLSKSILGIKSDTMFYKLILSYRSYHSSGIVGVSGYETEELVILRFINKQELIDLMNSGIKLLDMPPLEKGQSYEMKIERPNGYSLNVRRKGSSGKFEIGGASVNRNLATKIINSLNSFNP